MDTRIVDTKSVGARLTAVASADLDVAEIGPWMSRVYGEVARFLEADHSGPAGPPFARYHRLDEERFHIEAGFPVTTAVEGCNGVRGSSLPGGTVAVITHLGPYEQMEATYHALWSWIESRGGHPEGDPWEVYFSHLDEPSDTWRTEIVQPYRPN
jgi:effector-binding domain-containing protein